MARSDLIVDGALVRRLQLAHSDYLADYFTGPRREILRDDGMTAFLSEAAEETSFKRRITLVGNESPEQIDAVLAVHDRNRTAVIAEINPANFYADASDKNRLTKLLTSRGFFPGEFRSVWYATTREATSDETDEIIVKTFTADEIDDFLSELDRLGIEAGPSTKEIRRSEAGNSWIHYVAYVDGQPAATSTLRVSGGVGYLAWTYTSESFRRRGIHRRLIGQRVSDARDCDAELAFSVTSFGIPSARNLQRSGFHLAYNYILMVRPKQT